MCTLSPPSDGKELQEFKLFKLNHWLWAKFIDNIFFPPRLWRGERRDFNYFGTRPNHYTRM
ncbi:MAG: hypothetical protein LBR79_03905 [Oscillospiraceae bacterium]|nr:hypothetical protein [Oscillospiraceae bacterium]